MGNALKQVILPYIIGKMGSNNRASAIVKQGRFLYITTATTIVVVWYAAWRNERVAPHEIAFPFPLLSTLKPKYEPDRPEQELPHEQTQRGTHEKRLKGSSAPTALSGPFALGKGISKANELSGKFKYAWGGGHSQLGVASNGGFDCSGTVCAVLGAMEVLNTPLTSGQLMTFGAKGPGKFVTIYANEKHTFMKLNVNGKWMWFGTGSDKEALRGGPAWGNHDPDLKAYAVRHPIGF